MTDPLSGLVKMFSSLLLVLGMIVFIAYLGRRLFRSRFKRWQTRPLIHVVSTAYLGTKREISVIEIGREYFVVGITQNQISLITRLEKPPLPPDSHEKIEEFAPV